MSIIIPASIEFPWPSTAASIPAGFSEESALYGYYTKGAAASADPGVEGGAATHLHTSPTHIHTVSSHNHGTAAMSPPSSSASFWTTGSSITTAIGSHYHSSGTSGNQTANLSPVVGTFDTAANQPPYYTVRWVRSLGTSLGVPDGMWVYWSDPVTPPTGSWALQSGPNGRYLLGVTSGGTAAVTGGSSATHTHSGASHPHGLAAHAHSSNASGANIGTVQLDGSGVVSSRAPDAHVHTVSYGTSSASNSSSVSAGTTGGSGTLNPPYRYLGVYQNNTGGVDLQIGFIGLCLNPLASVPGGWTVCDGSNGTLDMRGYFSLCTDTVGDIATSGGSATHDHTDPVAHKHTTAHTHPLTTSNSTTSNATGGGPTYNAGISNAHKHTGTSAASSASDSGTAPQLVDTANHEPPHLTVLYVMYTGAVGVDITAPDEGGTVSSPSFDVTWDITDTVEDQATYRVRIYAADQTTLIHDSTITASTDQTYTIPSGTALRTGNTYYIKVNVTVTGGLPGESLLWPISASWTPPTTIANLTATAVGGV